MSYPTVPVPKAPATFGGPKSPESIQKGIATRRANIHARAAIEAGLQKTIAELQDEVRRLEARAADLRRAAAANTAACRLTGDRLLTGEEIVASSAPWSNVCGIYFLIRCKEVVYVGQSIEVHSRICKHKKEFDSYAYIEVDRKMLDKLESLYIYAPRPALNGIYSNGRTAAPLRLDQLLGAS